MLGSASSSPVGAATAAELLRDRYGLEGELCQLTGERDENFLIKVADRRALILKVFGLSQPHGEAELLAAILTHLERHAPDLPVPRLSHSRDGRAVNSFSGDDGRERNAVLYSFLPGKPLIEAERSSDQAHQCGALLARTAIALKDFNHPRMYRPVVWDLRHVPALRTLLPQIDGLPFDMFIREFLDEFAVAAAPRLAALLQQFVHNDFNARNIIVDKQDDSRITGIIDFGDAVHSARVADVAVGVIGQLSMPDSADNAMGAFVEAYQAISPLQPDEVRLLPWLVAGRIVQNVVITSWYRSRNPDNEHFAAFGPQFFAWRIEFAARLHAKARGQATL